MADNSKKTQKKSPLGGFVVFLVIILINLFSEAGPRARAALIPLLLIVAVLILIIAAAVKAAKRSSGTADRTSPVRAAGETRGHTSREAFPSPDAYCLVCDQTNTDHFERDRQRRLRQLDYWLSVGIIDRKEYRTLKARYSQSVPHGGV